jgi:hypothetical protein
VAAFKTLADIPDNELLTVVIFSDEATTTYIQPMHAMNTAWLCTPDLSKRYIKEITLVSPFINPNRPNRLEYPLNTPLNALNLLCRVEYTDGYAEVPIDGTKAYMSGMDGFVATIVGQEIPDLTLHYRPSANEYNYTQRATSGPHISRRCYAVVVDKDDSINVKIFLTFEWRGVDGYRIRYWLYHMTRQRYWDITDKVMPGDGSMSYNPLAFGVLQRLVLTVQLDKVDGLFREYRFVQIVDVVVNQTTHQSPWLVHYEVGQNEPSGSGLYCEYRYVQAGYSEAKLNMHCRNVDEWLNRLYYNTRPLVDRLTEGMPPRPTMFEVEAIQPFIYVTAMHVEFGLTVAGLYVAVLAIETRARGFVLTDFIVHQPRRLMGRLIHHHIHDLDKAILPEETIDFIQLHSQYQTLQYAKRQWVIRHATIAWHDLISDIPVALTRHVVQPVADAIAIHATPLKREEDLHVDAIVLIHDDSIAATTDMRS